jgi:hypothetical protein
VGEIEELGAMVEIAEGDFTTETQRTRSYEELGNILI